MGTGGSISRDGPVPLSALLDDAARSIPSTASELFPSDGFLFSGNRHDSVPRRLLLDTRLTPLERNAWQVFRLLLNDDGITAFPTYEALRPYLASMPCTPKASHETVARALTLLRLTRWLSLVRRRRDPKTGRIQGNLYVLHDEPLTPFEAMQLDPDYLSLVSQALTHASKAVQRVGLHTLREIAEDPLLSGRSLPTRLQVLAQRLADGQTGEATSYPQESDAAKSEEGKNALLRNDDSPTSESEAGCKPASDRTLRNPKEDRTVRKNRINEVRTVPRAKTLQSLRLPERFLHLKEEQQAGAVIALQQVEETQRQAVLDEWAARCRGSTVRNPAGYLFGIIQKAIRGEFKAWAGEGEPASPQARTSAPPPPLQPSASNGPDREVARGYLAQIRAAMRDS
ncbi:hypothetical protein GO613_17220 [Azoarcus communis]|uniref:STY4528 family pathogenicity island replication protein n=1 Tax=Parazoarcus communis TaxID=41977 RepID=UPI001459BBD1|nr:STY4528 family pathogenicity island replication protein [Parazoarcus communis]NMG49840.1 hypothetical protein [Parazoarcus communis]